MAATTADSRLEWLHAYWRAVNYLSAGQIYLRANPLLREPLKPEHIKPRLLGHWGTSPGLNLIYAHLDRLIQDTDARVLLVVGPGHGGPAIRANVWLEGVMSEVYPDLSRDAQGAHKLLRDFSWPGGVPSHVTGGTHDAQVPIPGVAEGAKGVLKDGGSKRRAAAEQAAKAVGAKIEQFYFAFGDTDVFVIADAPDHASSAAVSLAVSASGAARIKTMVLMTPEEMDQAAKKKVGYRAPGQ